MPSNLCNPEEEFIDYVSRYPSPRERALINNSDQCPNPMKDVYDAWHCPHWGTGGVCCDCGAQWDEHKKGWIGS